VIPSSRAGSLPQVFGLLHVAPVRRRFNVWEPAREYGGSVNERVDCDSAFASRLAPTGFWVVACGTCPPPIQCGMLAVPCVRRRSNVGAGLLAKAVGQSMKVWTVVPPSRASSLPLAAPACFSQHLQAKRPQPPATTTSSVGLPEAAVFMFATFYSLLLTSPPMSCSKNIGIG
jgi:hypothetical protein